MLWLKIFLSLLSFKQKKTALWRFLYYPRYDFSNLLLDVCRNRRIAFSFI